MAHELAEDRMLEELKSGIQTIRYQLSTLHTSNGQSPFSTIYLEIEEGGEFEREEALICEEMIVQRLEGMKNHEKLCHGDFVPSNIIVKENGEYAIIDWSHATQGNGSADVANTYLIFSMRNQKELAEKYVNLYCEKTGTDKKEVQRWIPIVAAIRKTKGKVEEQEMLEQWINIVDYE